MEIKSNYEIQAEKSKLEFIKWDHIKIAKKFNLEYDENYLYIYFLKQKYRLNKSTGNIEKTYDEVNYIGAKHNEVMTILDLLSYSKDNLQLSGNWTNVTSLKGTVQTGSIINHNDLFFSYANKFSGRINDFKKACEKLDAKEVKKGDVGYIIDLFEKLPLMVIFYEKDCDFPAEFKILWDENILDYMHYETTFYAVLHLFDRIEELIVT